MKIIPPHRFGPYAAGRRAFVLEIDGIDGGTRLLLPPRGGGVLTKPFAAQWVVLESEEVIWTGSRAGFQTGLLAAARVDIAVRVATDPRRIVIDQVPASFFANLDASLMPLVERAVRRHCKAVVASAPHCRSLAVLTALRAAAPELNPHDQVSHEGAELSELLQLVSRLAVTHSHEPTPSRLFDVSVTMSGCALSHDIRAELLDAREGRRKMVGSDVESLIARTQNEAAITELSLRAADTLQLHQEEARAFVEETVSHYQRFRNSTSRNTRRTQR